MNDRILLQKDLFEASNLSPNTESVDYQQKMTEHIEIGKRELNLEKMKKTDIYYA